ncbi:MAG: hypothetical protein UV74_C0002G0027 [Candidatus Woesebacteria bacterium GW2011_GWB1_43_14]|uniref:Radical SAM core domain-containing protein n=1 Tax=Candidatus Woesebacteria bacterium GW2011_GWB1_43_14 TaxID=1618578 RepID=A0A0G1GJ63_9BACT|nr:MAG: hypothetical protein UV51_C0004G0074 [Candidatus Woesebacteria bacterium GW2011_GWC1_42_9]KKS98808.1 MAG: hypothetical protein UV74_C0002G0027 [Candidatus Woesebacteria bacterium GW2011_GWB1_43_14]
MSRHERLTQIYSTWGDKLLQHTDVLNSIQEKRQFQPITIQLAPVEACESDCPFCSVAARPIKSYLPFDQLSKCLQDFRSLGAKSLEITGGGNPLLYRDRENGKNINDVVQLAAKLGLDIGIITNGHDLKVLNPGLYDQINWIRISLIKLDEGVAPEAYDFHGFPESKLGFSYIIYETGGVPDPLSKTGRTYTGTTAETIQKMASLVEMHPDVKFVRIAGNCLIKGNNAVIRDKYKDVIDAVDEHGKFFIKDIGDNDSPFNDGCYIGMIRPYVAPSPTGDGYMVYTCTSHVLNTRTYDPAYALCKIEDIIPAWQRMNEKFATDGHPYEVKGNGGHNWCHSCKFCYYHNNNQLLHSVSNEMPDKNFP